MKYTSKPVDFEKLKNERKFSDRVKKYIAQVLLAAQVLGAVPALGVEPQVVEVDLQKFSIQYEQEKEKESNVQDKGANEQQVVEIDLQKFSAQYEQEKEKESNVQDKGTSKKNSRRVIIKSKILDRAVENFGSRNEIDRDNIQEFYNDMVKRKEILDKILINLERGTNKVKKFDNYFTYSKQELLKMQKKGIGVLIQKAEDSCYNFDKMYTPSDLIKIQEFYEKHFGEIRDNPELSEKEKVIAATMILSSLMTYDYKAADKSHIYSDAALYTSRNQYSFMKYGTGICVAYADSMKIIGNMLGVDIRSFPVLTDLGYKEVSSKEKKNIVNELNTASMLTKADHQVNIVNFSDGSSYLLDMTNYDAFKESRDHSRALNFYFTDMKNFKGAHSVNGQMLATLPKYREMAKKCTKMSPEYIKSVQEKLVDKVPYIAMMQEMDELQRENGYTKKETSLIYKARKSVASIFGKFKGNKVKGYLPNNESYVAQYDNSNTSRTDFIERISNNGEYRKILEEKMKNYDTQKQVAKKVSEYDRSEI